MDTMSIKDIITVGIPEISFAVLFGIMLFVKLSKEIHKPLFIVKMVLTLIFAQAAIFINRRYNSNTSVVLLVNVLIYALCFRVIWKLNMRQSLCSGGIIIFMLLSLDIMTMPIADVLLQRYNSVEFFSYRFIFSLPTRIAQIVIILTIYYFKINLHKSSILNEDWCKLSVGQKTTSVFLLSMIAASILFNTNYVALFLKQVKYQDLNTSLNMTIVLLETVLFMIITLVLFSRTTSYEYYKQLLSKQPTEIFTMMLDKANIGEARSYEKMLKEHFDKLIKEGVDINEK